MGFRIVHDLTPINFTPGNESRIKYIVIHYYGGLTSAKNISNWFKNPDAKSSAHYNVDEGEDIYQSVLDKDVAWHCGTSGTYYHPACRNANSIGVEVRPSKVTASGTLYASDRDWYFDKVVEDRAVEFVRHLMDLYNVPLENVVRHYDVTRKLCPRPYCGADINTYYGVTGDEMWAKFKKRIKEDITMGQYDEIMGKLEAQGQTIEAQGRTIDMQARQIATLENSVLPVYKHIDDVPEWGREAVKDAVVRGILKGVSDDDLGLSWDFLRVLVQAYRREQADITQPVESAAEAEDTEGA